MESVKSARARLGSYPLHLASCAPEAANYGRCDQHNITDIAGIQIRVKITCSYIIYSRCVGEQLGEVAKHQCAKEWSVFMTCVRNSAKKLGTKL